MEEFQIAWNAITAQLVVSSNEQYLIILADMHAKLHTNLKCLYPVAIVALVELQKSLVDEQDYYTGTTPTPSELGIEGGQRGSQLLSADRIRV